MSAAELLTEIPRKIWTRDDVHLLADFGFPNTSKLELVAGELIQRMGKKRPHSIWLKVVRNWLEITFGADYVESETPIDVAVAENLWNEPEPDLIVLSRPFHEYTANPTPADLLLVVEISDSTVSLDLKLKAPLYARAGIVEYWVVDLAKRLLHVHREPAEGAYGSVGRYEFAATVAPLASPAAAFCMDELDVRSDASGYGWGRL